MCQDVLATYLYKQIPVTWLHLPGNIIILIHPQLIQPYPKTFKKCVIRFSPHLSPVFIPPGPILQTMFAKIHNHFFTYVIRTPKGVFCFTRLWVTPNLISKAFILCKACIAISRSARCASGEYQFLSIRSLLIRQIVFHKCNPDPQAQPM